MHTRGKLRHARTRFIHGTVALATSVRTEKPVATSAHNESAHVRGLFGNSEPQG